MNCSAVAQGGLRQAQPRRPACGPGSGRTPASASNGSVKIRSGMVAATCSISMPPSERGDQHRPAAAAIDRPRRGRTRGRSSSLLRPARGGRPCLPGPVWTVTSRWPRMLAATVSASSRLRTSCTPRCARDFGDRSLAAAAGVDLRLDHGRSARPGDERVAGGLGAVGDNAAGHRHARIAENLLGLVFVDLHRCGHLLAPSMRRQAFSATAPKSTGFSENSATGSHVGSRSSRG